MNSTTMKFIGVLIVIVAVITLLLTSCSSFRKKDPIQLTAKAVEEFQDKRFGLFIHFGLYSVPAGVWGEDTMPVGTVAEQIMRHFAIPRDEYRQLASVFNPTEFNPEQIVRMAKDAGMKYIVITTKHIDGFALFQSDYDNYNIKDGTPYGRDLLKELSEECRRQGMKLGVYYSQTRDLDEYHSVCVWGNNWDWEKDDPGRNLQAYMDAKVKPQLTELMTNYGDIFCIWFDVPGIITKEQAQDLYDLVKRYQPGCLVNSRIGCGLGDYGVMGDNQIPPGVVSGVWECPATMNHTWGYHQLDDAWKSSNHMITQLVDLASKNVNYLLNIGPKGDGSIPEESIKSLEEMGKWIKINGEAIYNTGPSPWFQEIDGLRITSGNQVLYATLLKPEMDNVTLYNLNNEISRVEVLHTGTPLNFKHERLDTPSVSTLEISIPEDLRDETLPVIKIHMKGAPDVQNLPTQMGTGHVLMHAAMANVVNMGGDLSISGIDGTIDIGEWPYFATENWNKIDDYLEWDFILIEPGTFEVQVINVSTSRVLSRYTQRWNSIYKADNDYNILSFSVNDQVATGRITGQEALEGIRSVYRPEFTNLIGTITIDRPGAFKARLKADFINPDDQEGIVVHEVRLKKIN